MRLKTILAQIADVAGEFETCTLAVQRMRDDIVRNPPLAGQLKITRTAITKTLDRLEITYVVRAFTLFEATLRELWAHAFHRKTEPTVRVLVDALASASKLIPQQFVDRVHEICGFRNAIVHLNATSKYEYSLQECVHALKAYLSYMPRQW